MKLVVHVKAETFLILAAGHRRFIPRTEAAWDALWSRLPDGSWSPEDPRVRLDPGTYENLRAWVLWPARAAWDSYEAVLL